MGLGLNLDFDMDYKISHTIVTTSTRKERKINVNVFYINMRCPFANSGPSPHGYGVRVGLIPMLIGGPWVSC